MKANIPYGIKPQSKGQQSGQRRRRRS